MQNRALHPFDIYLDQYIPPTREEIPLPLILMILSPFIGVFIVFILIVRANLADLRNDRVMVDNEHPGPLQNHHVAAEDDEPDPLQVNEPAMLAIPQEPINETRLASVGLAEHQARDHRTLGFFYDFATCGIADDPVVLNTGDIVSERTAIKLIQNQARLPRGTAVEFFRSPALQNLLNTLIDEEVEKRAAKNRNRRKT